MLELHLKHIITIFRVKWKTLIIKVFLTLSALLNFSSAFSQCIPGANSGANCGLWITNVNVLGTTLNNNSACSSPYISYPAVGTSTATLTSGTTYSISVTNDGSSAAFCSVWLDVNNDGMFNCSHGDELVVKNLVIPQTPFGGSGGQTATANFLVPSLATGGNTKLRVRIDHLQSTVPNGVTNPCSALIYGETEDYTVDVVPNGIPACVPATIVPNPSFEGPQNNMENLQLTGNWFNGAQQSTSDYLNGSNWTFPPMPLPNGTGMLGQYYSQEYKEFSGTCLNTPFLAGVTYSMQMSVASNQMPGGTTPIYGPVDITLYGNTICGNYPFNGGGPNQSSCPPVANWPVLATANYNPTNAWSTITFTFTPTTDINAILFGPPCNMPASYPQVASGNVGPYFYYDNIIVNTELTIDQTGAICSNDLVLTGSGVNVVGATYQWYLNGTPIAGQTSNTLNVSANGLPPGNYTLLAEFGCTCAQASYTVVADASPNITVSAPNGPFCPGDAVTLTASNASTYIWSAGTTPSTGSSVVVTPSVTTSYTVIGSAVGCIDDTASITIIVNPSQTATLSYPDSVVCASNNYQQNAIVTGTTGGIFTVINNATGSPNPNPISLNQVTGHIGNNVSPGDYTIIYTPPGLCAIPDSFNFVVTPSNAEFQYAAGSYCQNTSPNATPTFIGGMYPGPGVFTATPAGLFFVDNTTGVVDLTASTPGTYTVTNTLTNPNCPGSYSNTITIVAAPTATLTYPSNIYCTSGTATPTLTPAYSAAYSASPSGLSINSSTGVINLSSSALGTYTITANFYLGISPYCSGSATFDLTITNTTSAQFSYAGPYCQNDINPSPTFASGASAGNFSASPSGLVFVSSTTGQVNLATSTAGTYTVYNTIPSSGSCPAVFDSATIIINPMQDASFSYVNTTFCQSATTASPSITGVSGGTFTSSPAGLIMDINTGDVDLSSPTGTYTITYTTPGPCPDSTNLSITISTSPSAQFSYAGPYCHNESNPFPTFGSGASAGTFSASPVGLVFISSSSGEVNLSASNPGTYTVTNTIPASGSCPQTSATTTITINSVGNASFTYSDNSYCQTTGTITPNISGSPGGTFTVSPTGLIIDPLTGEIDLYSPANTYTVTYTTPEPCSANSSQVVQITSSFSIDVNSEVICEGETTTLIATPSLSGGSYSWSPSGQTSGSIDVAPTETTNYTVTYSLNGCTANTTGTVTVIPLPNAIITTPYTDISLGEIINLNAGNADSYLWSTGETEQEITVSPIESISYCVTITENGCSDSTCITIQIGCESLIFAPNCITPNNDNTNDVFTVKGDCISELHLIIINRWGEVIFESFEMDNHWNGTYEGKPVSDGVYFYRIDARGFDNKYHEIVGHVSVLK